MVKGIYKFSFRVTFSNSNTEVYGSAYDIIEAITLAVMVNNRAKQAKGDNTLTLISHVNRAEVIPNTQNDSTERINADDYLDH